MEKIILVRHTEAEGGNDIYRGQTDLDLVPEGIEHAKRLGEKLKDMHIDKIYTSKLKRAIKTAEGIAEPHGLKLTKTPKLNEINFGIFDGLQRKVVLKKYLDIYKARRKDRIHFRIPGGGENYIDVRDRAQSFILGEAKKNPGKTLMFVAHGSLIKSILSTLIKNKTWDEIGAMLTYGCRVFLKHNGGKLHFVKIVND